MNHGRHGTHGKGTQTWFTLLLVLIQALTGLATVNAQNLVHNGSFELGATAGGWVWTGAGQDYDGVTKLPTVTADAQHGTYAASLVMSDNNVQIGSRPFWLEAGTQYTLSFYHKAGAGTVSNFKYSIDRPYEIDNWDNQITLGGTFARTSYNLTPTQSGWHVVKFANFSPSSTALVDGVQVEAGSSASAFAPLATVEMGLDTAMPFNLFTQDDDLNFNLKFYNNSTESTEIAYWEVYDFYNASVTNGYVTNVCSAGLETLTMPLPQNGWHRITVRDADDYSNADEIVANVYPLAARAIENDVAGRFGTHGNYSVLIGTNMARVGFTYDRSLSVKAPLMSWNLIEASDGVYTFNYNAEAEKSATNGLIHIGQLGSEYNKAFTSWMTNGDDSINIPAWSNYVWHTVSNYGPLNLGVVTNWSLWNEFGDELADTDVGAWFNNPVNAATVFESGIRAITNADPDARILVFEEFAAGRIASTWTNIDADVRAHVDVVATHMYPQDQREEDGHNRYYGDDGSTDAQNQWDSSGVGWGTNGMVAPWATISQWHADNASSTELWNAEYGSWSYPVLTGPDFWWYCRGDVSGFQSAYPDKMEHWERHRGPLTCARVISSTMRALGRGFSKNIYYDSRSWYWSMVEDTNPNNNNATHTTLMAHGNRNHKQQMIALAVGQSLVDTFSTASIITNSTAGVTDIEMYLFEMTGSNVVAAWSLDFKNRSLTVSETYTVLDMMGNEVSQTAGTVTITRYPQYLVSTAAAADIKTDLAGAAHALLGDGAGPNVSISLLQQGDLKTVQWFGYGDRWVNDYYVQSGSFGNTTNIMWSWRTNSGTWSDYTQSNFITLGLTSSDSVSVRGKDREQNVTEVTFEVTAEEARWSDALTPLIRTLNAGTLYLY